MENVAIWCVVTSGVFPIYHVARGDTTTFCGRHIKTPDCPGPGSFMDICERCWVRYEGDEWKT